MPPAERKTRQKFLVLWTIADADGYIYGLEICKRTQLSSGIVYRFLGQLELNGHVTAEWEAVDPREHGRPRRRFYQLTSSGHALLREYEVRAWI